MNLSVFFWLRILLLGLSVATVSYRHTSDAGCGGLDRFSSTECHHLIAFFILSLLGSVILIRLLAVRSKGDLYPPSWSTNPFNISQPLSVGHMLAWFLFVDGITRLLLGYIHCDFLTRDGMFMVANGLGVFVAVHLSRLWLRRRIVDVPQELNFH